MVKSLGDYQVGDEAFNLRDLLDRILATVVATYESNGVPLPLRQYWMLGRPAEDCEQAVVSFIQAYLGAPGDQANVPQHCNVPRSAVLEIAVSRNYPIGVGGKPETPANIQKASEWSAVDAWILLESLQAFDTWENDVPGLGVIATVSANDPAGAIQTVVMNLTVSIP